MMDKPNAFGRPWARIKELARSPQFAFWLTVAIVVLVVLRPVMSMTLGSVYTVSAFPDLSLLIIIMLFAMCTLGLNVVTGYCGLLHLGFFGFTAFGAFLTGYILLWLKQNGLYGPWSFWICLPVSALAGAAFGAIIGWPTLRLTGDYFAIVTFGYAEIIRQAAHNMSQITGGPFGMRDIPRPVFFGHTFSLATPYGFYYTMLILLTLTVLACRRLERSRTGRSWAAIHGDETAAASCGINLASAKTAAFAVSAGIGSLTGCFYAVLKVNIDATHFEFMQSVLILCYIVLGGLGSIRGAILGAAILVALGEYLRDPLASLELPGETRFIIFGLLMVVIMRFRPDGLLPRRHKSEQSGLLEEPARKTISTGEPS